MLGKEVINDKPLTGESAQIVREEAKKVLEERNNEKTPSIEERAKKRATDCVKGYGTKSEYDMGLEDGQYHGYFAGATKQKEIDIELVDKWLRKHLPRVISNYPLNDNVVTDMLNEDMRADLRKYLEEQ